MPKEDPPYEVGYGKPPKGGQFTKGKSGNPKGRPKGSKNLANIVMRECRQPVRVNSPRGSRTVSKLEAVVMQLGNKAAQGEARATREFLPLVQRSEEVVNSASGSAMLQESGQLIMQIVRRRMQSLAADKSFTVQPPSEDESE
jgi:hypothetical protein